MFTKFYCAAVKLYNLKDNAHLSTLVYLCRTAAQVILWHDKGNRSINRAKRAVTLLVERHVQGDALVSFHRGFPDGERDHVAEMSFLVEGVETQQQQVAADQ